MLQAGLCAGTLTVLKPCPWRWCEREAGGFSAVLSPLCHRREEGRQEHPPKWMTAFPSGLPTCQQIGGGESGVSVAGMH